MKKTILALVIASASFTASANVPHPAHNGNTKPSATMVFKEKVSKVCGIVTANAYQEGSIKFNDESSYSENFVKFELATNDPKNTSKAKITVHKIEGEIKTLKGKNATTKLWIGEQSEVMRADDLTAKSEYTFDMKAGNNSKEFEAILVTAENSTEIAYAGDGTEYKVEATINVTCI